MPSEAPSQRSECKRQGFGFSRFLFACGLHDGGEGWPRLRRPVTAAASLFCCHTLCSVRCGISDREIKLSYFMSFNPYISDFRVEDDDFFASVSEARAFQLDEKVIEPKLSCSMQMFSDEVPIEVHAVGNICDPERFSSISVAISSLMKSWRN